MNENRGLFVLDGITGMLIATVLLLSILAGLTVLGLSTQNANANNFYKIENPTTIKMIDPTSGAHVVDVK